MVKLIEIQTAIVDKLKSKFTGIKVKALDTENIVRPSFSVKLDSIKANDFMREALEKNMTVRVYYYGTTIKKNDIELLNVRDDLSELFLEDNILKINENTILQIEEINFDMVDEVLVMDFDLLISEDYNRVDDTPLMEELEI